MNTIEEIVKKFLQKKDSRKYAENGACSFNSSIGYSDFYQFCLKLAKLSAEWALSNQWINVAERLPSKDELVLCEMKSNGAIVSGYIFVNDKGIPQVKTSTSFEFVDYEFYEPIKWMKKPD